MIVDPWQRKGKINGYFKNSTYIVLQQHQDQANFQRKGSSIISNFSAFTTTLIELSNRAIKSTVPPQQPHKLGSIFLGHLAYTQVVYKENTYELKHVT